MRRLRLLELRAPGALAWLALAASSAGQTARELPVLPKEAPWEGRSRALALPPDHPWATPAEISNLTRTPRYDETMAFLQRLAAAAPQIRLVTLGQSPEGRAIVLAVASREGARTPEELRRNARPTLFAQACIHAGEVDGKDAGLMLLRDLSVRGNKRALLERANFLFVPIFNVDGHERFSASTRINQRGPVESGWRTTARNLNLNRDYAKLDAPETRQLVRALNAWSPDLYFDLHVTDDTDHQYDITFGHNWPTAWSPAIARWLQQTLLPAGRAELSAQGHTPGPFVQLVDAQDPEKGLLAWFGGPRYSNGYGDARHLPSILVESHSLKPFARRVLGTYVLLESTLETLGREAGTLRAAVAEDQARRPAELVLDWTAPETPGRRIELDGIAWRLAPSEVSGGMRIEYTGEPKHFEVAVLDRTLARVSARRPKAYWIPPGWDDVIERLALHGLRLERLAAPRTLEVEMYRIREPRLASTPFEGRVGVEATFVPERRRESFARGAVRVSTDQALGDLAMLLLEPAAPDSFFAWGFFFEVLQPTEYVEAYVMESMGERMLAEDKALREGFEARLAADHAFAANPAARLQWLYERTPFHDERAFLYPVARELP